MMRLRQEQKCVDVGWKKPVLSLSKGVAFPPMDCSGRLVDTRYALYPPYIFSIHQGEQFGVK